MVKPAAAANLSRRLRDRLGSDLSGFLDSFGAAGVRPGLYAYQVADGELHRRCIHLRVHNDGSGLLMVDAGDVIHVNQTAALAAKSALEKKPLERTVRTMLARVRGARRTRLEQEISRIYRLVDQLGETTDGCQGCRLDWLERTALFSTPVDAPYKADLALTYGCNNHCGHCYNQRARRNMPAMGVAQWRRVVRRLASLGIPHVIFTGGEPTLFDGLAELVGQANRRGLITGVNTNGRRLGHRRLAQSLARAGLSHVQITLHSCRAEVHNAVSGTESFHQTVNGIRSALDAGLYTVSNTTLTRRNIDHGEQIVEFLAGLGLKTLAANGMIYSGQGRTSDDALDETELGPLVVRLRDRAAELGMRFLWYTPTAYCRLSPVELELGPRRCNAAEYSIAIEPNGDVLPCQSYYQPAGNILRDRWETIWESQLFHSFRQRSRDPQRWGLPPECRDCFELPLCGGGCRLEREWESVCQAEKREAEPWTSTHC